MEAFHRVVSGVYLFALRSMVGTRTGRLCLLQ